MSTIAEELKKLREAQDGGNPNYVETIEGTLASPFGEYSPEELLAEIIQNDATVKLYLNGSSLDLGNGTLYPTSTNDTNRLYFQAVARGSTDITEWIAYTATYDESTFELIRAYALSGGSAFDMLPYANQIPATLTIIHHPLPEAGS